MEEIATPIPPVPEVVPEKKRKNVKRKEEVLKTIEKEDVKEIDAKIEIDEEPPTKKLRITKDDDRSTKEEEPSILRGAFIKPLLLAGIASASFFVNNYYKTSVPAVVAPTLQKKKDSSKTIQPSNFLFQSASQRQSIIPGFTV